MTKSIVISLVAAAPVDDHVQCASDDVYTPLEKITHQRSCREDGRRCLLQLLLQLVETLLVAG